MELSKYSVKLKEMVGKHKYVLLVLLIGLALMMLPDRNSGTNKSESTPAQNDVQAITTEEKLACILSQIDGAGEVSVMLMEAGGEEYIYQVNSDITENATKTDTVTITDENRNQEGLIRQILPPQYAGAIIVCSGADDPQIRLSVVEAVSRITGLGSNRISVLKMK